MRIRWLEAEFDHKLEFNEGTEEELLTVIKEGWNRSVSMKIETLLKRLKVPAANIPKGKDDRIKLLHREAVKH